MKLTRLLRGLDIINISGKTSEEVSGVFFSADKCVEKFSCLWRFQD